MQAKIRHLELVDQDNLLDEGMALIMNAEARSLHVHDNRLAWQKFRAAKVTLLKEIYGHTSARACKHSARGIQYSLANVPMSHGVVRHITCTEQC